MWYFRSDIQLPKTKKKKKKKRINYWFGNKTTPFFVHPPTPNPHHPPFPFLPFPPPNTPPKKFSPLFQRVSPLKEVTSPVNSQKKKHEQCVGTFSYIFYWSVGGTVQIPLRKTKKNKEKQQHQPTTASLPPANRPIRIVK